MKVFNSIQELDQTISKHEGSVFFLVDENTHEHCLPVVLSELPSLGDFEILEMAAGEENKTLEMANQLWLAMLELNADRYSLLINIGGGVVTDMGGFVAALFKRGIDFIHVPTSLLAMVDAAHGGKTGVDLNMAKNVVGSFSLPSLVVLMPEVLTTLPENHLFSGYAEMLKHALIADKKHWSAIALNELYIDETIIEKSAAIKIDIVEKDPTEQGMRKVLNFGHTLGHAIESYCLQTGNTVLHGEAVAAGMICAAFLSVKKVGLTEESFQQIVEVVQRNFKKISVNDIDALLDWLQHDKKNINSEFRFVLIKEIGIPVYNIPVTLIEAKEAITYYQNL